MRIVLSVLATLFISNLCFSQVSYSLVDAKILGSTGTEQFQKMAVDEDGNTYVLATTSSTANNNDLNIDYYGGGDVWLIKLDANKDIIWQKSYGGSDLDIGTGINILSNGDILLFIRSSSSPSGNRVAPRKGLYFDVWVVEVDKTDGSIIRQRSIGGDSSISYLDSKIRSNGDIVMLSVTNDSGMGSFDIAEPPLNLDSVTADPWIAILDNQLNIIQQRRITQGATTLSSTGSGHGTLLLDGNYVYVATSSNGAIGGFKSDSSFNTPEVTFNMDCWLVKLDWNFNEIWDRTFGGISEDKVKGIVKTSDNSLLISMQTYSSVGGNKTSARVGNGTGYNIWLIKVDENGNKIGDKTYGNSGDLSVNSQFLRMGTNQFLFSGSASQVGQANNYDFSATQFYGGNSDGYLMAIDADLNVIDITAFGTPGGDAIRNICYKSGQLTIGGFSVYNGISPFHPINGYGQGDLWILDLYTTLGLTEEAMQQVKIYPNPVRRTLYLEDIQNKVADFSIYNLLGKKMDVQKKLNTSNYQINVRNLDAGVYFLNIKFKNGKIASKKFIVR